VDKLPAGSRAILRLCAFMAPAPVPMAMFVKGAEIVGEEAVRIVGSEPAKTGEFEVRDWKQALFAYSMANPALNDSFVVHALVQAVERQQINNEERPRVVERAVTLLARWVPRAIIGNWSAWRMALPHAEALWESQQNDSR